MREELILADQNETMMLFLATDKAMADTDRLIKISERVKQVLRRKLRPKTLNEGYPLNVTKEIEKYTKL